MADTQNLTPVEQPESKTPDAGAADLGLPKPFDASMTQALKTTVETIKEEHQAPQAPQTSEAPQVPQEIREPQAPAPEKAAEQAPQEVEKIKAPETKIETQVPTAAPAPVAAPAPLSEDDQMAQRIESILTEGLEDEYKKLPRNIQIKFRTKGEEIAGKINKLLHASKVQVRKVLSLILSWLRLIPHVNRYFLEQEAKIKADKIMEIKNGPPSQ